MQPLVFRRTVQALSWLALAFTILPAILYLTGRGTLPQVKLWTLLATILWFVVTPLWLERAPADVTADDGSASR